MDQSKKLRTKAQPIIMFENFGGNFIKIDNGKIYEEINNRNSLVGKFERTFSCNTVNLQS